MRDSTPCVALFLAAGLVLTPLGDLPLRTQQTLAADPDYFLWGSAIRSLYFQTSNGLVVVNFSTSSGAVPALLQIDSVPGTYPMPLNVVLWNWWARHADTLTMTFNRPLTDFSFDLVDPQYPTAEVLAGLAGLDLSTAPLGRVVEVLDAVNDPRGTVVRAFDASGNAVPVTFWITDLDPSYPIGVELSQITNLSASGGPVSALSIPGDGNSWPFTELRTLTALRVAVSSSGKPFSSISITPPVSGTTGVPGGDFIPITRLFGTPLPSLVPFERFTMKAATKPVSTKNEDAFKLIGSVRLGADSDGIDPVAEPVIVQLGSFTAAIPPQSFQRDAQGRIWFSSVIEGVTLEVSIDNIRDRTFRVITTGRGAVIRDTSTTVPVTLIIGNDGGSTSADIR